MLVLSRVFKRTFYSIFGKQTRIDIYYIEGRDLYKNDSRERIKHRSIRSNCSNKREKEIWIHIFAIVRCLSIANTLPNNTRIFLFTCPLSILQKNGGKNNSCYRTTPFDRKFTFESFHLFIHCRLRIAQLEKVIRIHIFSIDTMPFDRKLAFDHLFIYRCNKENKRTHPRLASRSPRVHPPTNRGQLEKFERPPGWGERRCADVGAAREYNGDFTAIMTHCRLLV